MEAKLLHDIGNVRPCQGQIREGVGHAAEERRVEELPGAPSETDVLDLASAGVCTALQWTMPTRSRMSSTYWAWDRKNPSRLCCTSTPRK
jgi:hypothetical protein